MPDDAVPDNSARMLSMRAGAHWRLQDLSEDEQQRANTFLHETPLHAHLGITLIEAGPEGVRARMPIAGNALNTTGNLHGGAIATLIDVAAGTCAAVGSGFTPGEQTIVTADMHLRYLGRPKGEFVDAVATILRAGRTLIIVDCEVVDAEGHVVAVCDFSAMVVNFRQPLRPEAVTDPAAPDL